ncbi:hypothetical protein [Erysipelothrix piscisicarius]|uniref:hypothetical protein n=1 Tax=Erysipelothrix piscisicarius TaxID=2485784 RepID=UPI0015F2C82D|nr:hypothetical protein [Erysipelothrix piscisicarius]
MEGNRYWQQRPCPLNLIIATLYNEIDQRLADLAALALSKEFMRKFANGTYGNGKTDECNLYADTAETLSNHLALNERAEADPQSVIQDIESGSIDYKVQFSTITFTPMKIRELMRLWNFIRDDREC